ncbi:hypothetical protein EJF18_50541 [Clavispora lusitaniae]|uniref:Uncharacterized protein n=1 Tax=Clavispora lusitaniae TaxID=36911 RepID=A0ACD0WPA4_CLALS|nr:hypothetical protein EJF14_50541 [Clavispora lusitaniae]QFZ34970.1 hypothetical protein EJF16_50541 [Clavispora lusitaniae]QFZ40655.1 hypothetical protein EJF15_50541 [Clavispora lusitaniae]QFZ46335.1 hypothetical protein EJF18_50541 [Clavispora lusitaniae]QFZ51997.1 hypothetical protein EJF17_50541 [Clavispora lusitaniae]
MFCFACAADDIRSGALKYGKSREDRRIP